MVDVSLLPDDGYSVTVAADGNGYGYGQCCQLAVTRWREDAGRGGWSWTTGSTG